MKNIKSFSAFKIIDAIINSPQESRKKWMLDLFEHHGSLIKAITVLNSGNKRISRSCCGLIKCIKQRFTYLDENPVRASFVYEPQDWKFSSATNYYTNGKGLLDLVRLD